VQGFAAAAGACLTFCAVSGQSKPGFVQAASSQDELKKQVGYKAVDDYVRSGMVIGLGTGSTAYFAVERVGQKLASGELKDIVAIPTSKKTQEQAESLKIPLDSLHTYSKLDVAIDGADAVDANLNLVKGGGAAHFREKIVETAAKQFVVIVDDSKLCNELGPSFPLPIEVVPFCHEHTARVIEALPSLAGCKAKLRQAKDKTLVADTPLKTDNGNYIYDLHFTGPIRDPTAAANELDATVGVVEHGLFIGMADVIVIAGKTGVIVESKSAPKYTKSGGGFLSAFRKSARRWEIK
jgi:ribose 5-phosphate isomerase A